MPPTIQDTLLDLFDHVRQDPDVLPTVPMEDWQVGSVEWRLLSGFQDMLEEVQQRMLQFRQMEQQLREREEQYRAIFEATIDGLSINDLEDGRVIVANPALCEMFGYTYEEFIDLPPNATIHPDTFHVVAEVLQKVQSGTPFQTRFLGMRKDGSVFHAEGRGTPFMYKGKPHLLGSTRDITEQVRAEQELREKEEQYRSVFEAVTDSLTISSLEDGQVVGANPATCKMLGYGYDELIGKLPIELVPPDYLPLVAEGLQTLRVGGRNDLLMLTLRKDGTTFPTEVHSTLFNYKGSPHLLTVSRDITERVQAEEQIREREEQYRSVFEATYDALFIMDLDGFLVEVNPAFCIMFGYPYEEIIGLQASNLTAPVSLTNLAEALKTLKSGRGTQTEMGQGLRKNGTTFYSESQSTTFTYLGKPHALGVVRDITERVEAEQQLREKEEQYRSIFEASVNGLFIVDLKDSHVVEVNPMACQMWGYTYEEMLGRPIGISDDTQQIPIHALEVIKAGGQFQMRDITTRKDGTSFHAEIHATPFTYKGRPHLLAIVRDITEQVEAEERLREKEAQYRSIFEATSDGLIIRDMNGFVVEANPAACTMHGYAYEEFLGLHRSDIIDPKDHTMVTEYMKAIQAGHSFLGQAVDLRKDGTPFPVEVRGTTFTYQGKPHTLSVLRDITERVQAQQLLEQRVEERTRELASLLEISHTVASTLQLKPLLGLILDQLKTVVDYTGAAILAVEDEELIILDNRSPIQEVQLMQLHFPLKDLGTIWETMIARETLIMPDVRDDTIMAQAFRAALGQLGETTFHYVRACMVVPLSLKEQVAGMLVLTSSKEEAFTPHHSALALAIANQAAVAIENARLYEQAQELAAFEERQRLARELHDSVSQALYGISLGVHTARMQLDRNPQDLAESLDYVLELAEAALIEMRALIFELRPESLETEGLVTALTKQAAALQARQGIIVQLDLGEEPDLPLKVKQDLYRVVQEALHNTVKHARASKVELRLDQSNEVVVMEVRDDGRGFDAAASFPGHLGLHSMRERVVNLGGMFQIESTKGQGTTICIRVPRQGALHR